MLDSQQVRADVGWRLHRLDPRRYDVATPTQTKAGETRLIATNTLLKQAAEAPECVSIHAFPQ